LVELGAYNTLVDSLIPTYGGNLFNIAWIEDKVRVNIPAVRDEDSVNYLARGQDYLFNLGGCPATFLVKVNGIGEYQTREFPADRKRIDIGAYCADDQRFRSVLGWTPQMNLEEGLARTLDYDRRHLDRYL
jgi:nucleoside-diphosphate-sugar epimerase